MVSDKKVFKGFFHQKTIEPLDPPAGLDRASLDPRGLIGRTYIRNP